MRFPVSHRITFIAYRPNSADMSLAIVYDSLDSALTVRDFSSFETEAARKWLFDLFLEDIKLRESTWGNGAWVKGLQVMALVDGSLQCSVDQRCDIESLVSNAFAAAREQFDHVG
jgi:hypothetical protein